MENDMGRIFRELENKKYTDKKRSLTDEELMTYIFGDDEDNMVAVTKIDKTNDTVNVKDNGMSQAKQIQELEEENINLKRINKEQENRIQNLENDLQSVMGKKPSAWKNINIAEITDLYSKGRSMNEIAKTLGISPHTVKSRLMESGMLK
jgi:DNA invertase Pin-like site-specific DNA recombinase